MNGFRRLCTLGMGYIGLPTSAVFADNGLTVIGVDVDKTIVDRINTGTPHISEPNLDILVRRVVARGNLRAVTEPEPADAFILAVPTPFRENHQPDLSYVEAATRSIAPFLRAGNLIVLESTSPVGTTEQISRWLAESCPQLTFPHQAGEQSDIRIAHCPERVLPGQILHEVVHNSRVIGGLTPKCAQLAMNLYGIFVKGECHLTTARTAELVKLAENSFRDVNIAYANELSMICDGLGINVWDLIRIANLHPRVNILNPGPGVGGHCIAVDPWFIVAADPKRARLVRTAREVNDSKPDFVIEKVESEIARLDKPAIACLGLAFKANVDDLRESPAVEIVGRLAAKTGLEILVVEPHIERLPPSLQRKNVELVSLDAALGRANLVLLLVDHKAFLNINQQRLAKKIVLDTRGVW